MGNDNVFCCWCGKSFSSFVTFSLGWALASQLFVTVCLCLWSSDPVVLPASFLTWNGGCSLFLPPLSFCSAVVYMFISKTWWREIKKRGASKMYTAGVIAVSKWKVLKMMHFNVSTRNSLVRERERRGANEWDRVAKCKWEQFGSWAVMKYSPPPNSYYLRKGRYIKQKTETGVLFMGQIISALIRPAAWHTILQFSQVQATKAGRCFIDCIRSMSTLFTLQQHCDYLGINFNTLTILLIWFSQAWTPFLH